LREVYVSKLQRFTVRVLHGFIVASMWLAGLYLLLMVVVFLW